jgi:hypothetical protein
MRCRRNHSRALALPIAAAVLLCGAGIAGAQTKIYPPGTDCANQPTIAERLLCGRQEYRREHGLSVVQPTIVPQGSAPNSVDEPDPIPDAPVPGALVLPSTEPQLMQQPNTASPNH